jgi:phosphate transport system substrate-binding protein
MTGRLADDVVRAYRTSSDLPAARFSLSSSNGCAVRFAVAASAAKDAVIAHDGVVVIVNPANRLSRIGEAELRRILSGTETTWSDESGVGGEIVPIVPDDATDEARALKAFLHGAKLGSGVQRAHGSADIVRVVAAASGRRRIGIVAFSTAAPAKVLALEGKPIPSALSIADHRYPLALDVSVSDDSRQHDTTAAELTQYARSDDAQSVVVRNGLIAKKGF